MEIVLLLIKQNLVMLIYLLIGFFLFRKKLVGVQGSADLGRMLLYVVMPTAIIKSYIADFSPDMLAGLAVSFAAALLSLIFAILISRAAFRKKESLERFGAAFSNAGFIGIPLVQMTLGSDAVFYIASFVALLNILQWTYGVLIMTGDRSAVSAKKIATNPIVISFLIGLCLFFLPFTLPETLESVVTTVSGMNGPLAMIILGVYLAQIPLKSLFKDGVVLRCTLMRLVVIPLLTIPVLMIFPARYTLIKFAVLIAAAAPVGSNVAIFAQIYDLDYTRAVKEICLSTLLCIVTLPLISGIAGSIF